ncbi:MBL fold metallo-hydrolase [Novosphingobium mangrovi (ex Huang et al. 2023)]|uniref:MBL fold metallo-hydrolase n=1 Tax=Novosphingobium mangrovi (ex Huang et al. 2023) TaxID=2976432 RepID=A0ABT2I6C6_9SPHN|nr:MBL fold metallo-hydrolase [Novosphingobium mangrovi (ex Huang et al. 2023)]MCT2400358.1 MBL fold metallo-hydrolase [Novosphingobium mangrovi (ex Huang et al. 2023)]
MQFVGCGDAFGSGGRFNTCFHLVGEQVNLLIDCGASSLISMKRLGIDRNAISTIVITHFHADHFGGIPFFILDAQFLSKRREPLTIVGPVGLTSWYERVMETAFPGSAGASRKFELHLLEITPDSSVKVGEATIRAYQAVHGPSDGPCLAVRIEAEGRSVAYTGDTEWTPALIPAAQDADLFIAEAYFRDKTVVTHLSLDAIEAHLAQLRPKRLVLTHMSDEMLQHRDRDNFETAEDGKVIAID